MLILLLSVVCAAIIIVECAAMAQILAAELPLPLRVLWLSAALIAPGIGAVLWFRLPRLLRTGRGQLGVPVQPLDDWIIPLGS